jgi:hypothetical protein
MCAGTYRYAGSAAAHRGSHSSADSCSDASTNGGSDQGTRTNQSAGFEFGFICRVVFGGVFIRGVQRRHCTSKTGIADGDQE